MEELEDTELEECFEAKMKDLSIEKQHNAETVVRGLIDKLQDHLDNYMIATYDYRGFLNEVQTLDIAIDVFNQRAYDVYMK